MVQSLVVKMIRAINASAPPVVWNVRIGRFVVSIQRDGANWTGAYHGNPAFSANTEDSVKDMVKDIYDNRSPEQGVAIGTDGGTLFVNNPDVFEHVFLNKQELDAHAEATVVHSTLGIRQYFEDHPLVQVDEIVFYNIHSLSEKLKFLKAPIRRMRKGDSVFLTKKQGGTYTVYVYSFQEQQFVKLAIPAGHVAPYGIGGAAGFGGTTARRPRSSSSRRSRKPKARRHAKHTATTSRRRRATRSRRHRRASKPRRA